MSRAGLGSSHGLQGLLCPSSPVWPRLPEAPLALPWVVKVSYLGHCLCSQNIWSLGICSQSSPHVQRHYHLMSEEERSLLGSPGYQLPAWGRGSIWGKHLAVGHLRTL